MRTSYNDLAIDFSIDYINFTALSFVFEKFLRSIPAHSHSSNSYEIHYIPYGKGHVKIDNVTYDIVPNTLYVTGPFVEHGQIPLKEDPMVEYCIYFKIKKKTIDKKKIESGSYIQLFEKTKFWFGPDTQNLHPLMQQIFYELENKYTGYMTQVETLLQQLVVKIIRNYENKIKSKNQFTHINLVDSKYLVIEECFLYEYSTITLDILSRRLGLSPRQTERLLRQHYGKTFLQKNAQAKMSAASMLLLDQNKRITDIARDLGYSSVEHFSTAFKRYHHESARNYRKILITQQETTERT